MYTVLFALLAQFPVTYNGRQVFVHSYDAQGMSYSLEVDSEKVRRKWEDFPQDFLDEFGWEIRYIKPAPAPVLLDTSSNKIIQHKLDLPYCFKQMSEGAREIELLPLRVYLATMPTIPLIEHEQYRQIRAVLAGKQFLSSSTYKFSRVGRQEFVVQGTFCKSLTTHEFKSLREARDSPIVRISIGGRAGALDCGFVGMIGRDGLLRLEGLIYSVTVDGEPLRLSISEIEQRAKRAALAGSRLATRTEAARARAESASRTRVLPSSDDAQSRAGATAVNNVIATRQGAAERAVEGMLIQMERAEASLERLNLVRAYVSCVSGGFVMEYVVLRGGKIIEVGLDLNTLPPEEESAGSLGDSLHLDDAMPKDEPFADPSAETFQEGDENEQHTEVGAQRLLEDKPFLGINDQSSNDERLRTLAQSNSQSSPKVSKVSNGSSRQMTWFDRFLGSLEREWLKVILITAVCGGAIIGLFKIIMDMV